jgi:two-component system NtrC family sensor kinase
VRAEKTVNPQAGGNEELEAQRALLARPSISIRVRIAAAFALLFILLGGMTVASVVFISEFRVKSQFLEKVGNYAFEIQQARRFEKNFFLYGSNLHDALNNIHTAHNHLDRGAEQMRRVLGAEKYRITRESLKKYEDLLEKLLETRGKGDSGDSPAQRQIESRLRKYGAQILDDAQEMIDRERLAMHAMLTTSTLAAVGFLVFMFFIMAFISGFIIRAILRPLGRFEKYTARIGSGDYSPITPSRKYRDEFSDLAIAINKMLHELKLRQDQLIHSGKMAAVGTLTSGIAHELNNPLNNIWMTTEALISDFQDYPDEKKLKMLEQIYNQVERASSTVRNLLDFTRKEQPAFTSVSIPKIMESTLKLIENELKLADIDLDIDVEEGLPEITGNPRNLQQVFLNLFLNTIQAMPDGGRLGVRVHVEDGLVRADVSDTGVGILPENLDKVFDPFFTTKEPGQGTGLGLSVSYGIVEKHGGKIIVESEVGKGTTFSVFLPPKREDQG